MAVDDSSLSQKVDILRRELRTQNRQERRNNLILTFVVLLLLAGVIAAGR